jgi:hypothetical protein
MRTWQMYPHPHPESARLKDPNKLPRHLVLKHSMCLHRSPTEVHPLQAPHLADGGVTLGNAVICHPVVWRVTVDQAAAIDIQRAVSAP